MIILLLVRVIIGIICFKFFLGAIGFSILGIAPGSFAAFWQSWIGNVVGGSIFAQLQSSGATQAFIKPIILFAVIGVILNSIQTNVK